MLSNNFLQTSKKNTAELSKKDMAASWLPDYQQDDELLLSPIHERSDGNGHLPLQRREGPEQNSLSAPPASPSEVADAAASTTATATAEPASESLPTSFIRGYFVNDDMWNSLHAQPIVLTVVISMSVFLPVTLALNHVVLDATSHLSVFLAASVFIFLSYEVAHRVLARLSSSFARLSKDKQIYAVSNLLKASVLASITPLAIVQLFRIFAFDEWDSNTLRNLGCIYSVPDFVSLLKVRRMAATTIVHHLCVCAFNFVSLRTDYSKMTVCRLIVVYGAFSCFSYVVYGLLGSRFLGVSANMSRHMAGGALGVYVACIGINWAWQAWYLSRLLSSEHKEQRLPVFVYMICVSFVMWDDAKLCFWLLRNVKARHEQQLHHAPQSVFLRGSTPLTPPPPPPVTAFHSGAVAVADSSQSPRLAVAASTQESQQQPHRLAPIRVAKRRGTALAATAAAVESQVADR